MTKRYIALDSVEYVRYAIIDNCGETVSVDFLTEREAEKARRESFDDNERYKVVAILYVDSKLVPPSQSEIDAAREILRRAEETA